MLVNRSAVIESLVVATHRLTRVTASAEGMVSPAVWRTLSIVESDGPIRVGDLAKASRVTQPAVSKALLPLIEDELVSRIADVDDARAWLVVITEAGRATLAEWRSRLAETMSPMFDRLDGEDWEALERAAAILGSALDGAEDAAA